MAFSKNLIKTLQRFGKRYQRFVKYCVILWKTLPTFSKTL